MIKYKSQLVESGRTIGKLEYQIRKLEEYIYKLKQEQTEKGITDFKDSIKFYKNFTTDLINLMDRYCLLDEFKRLRK